MRGKLIFITGVGVGYVLGTRAGRERFDQMVAQARKFWESPTVQEAAGVVQAQAGRLYDEGKQVVTDQARRLSHRNGKALEEGEPTRRRPGTRRAPQPVPGKLLLTTTSIAVPRLQWGRRFTCSRTRETRSRRWVS